MKIARLKRRTKQGVLLAALAAAGLAQPAVAQVVPAYTRDGVALPVTNTGNNLLVEVYKADSVFAFSIGVASFAAGKRLDWHFHPGGQIMIITDGVGYYQERGKARRTVRKGEVIKCLPGVEHWHGASAESAVMYMATNPTQKGATVWQEKVTDAQYNGTSISTKAGTGTKK